MANKVIRDYTPGKNDFLHFARVMNRNAEMDLAKSRGQMMSPMANHDAHGANDVAAVPQMTGAARYAQIQGNFKSALGDSGNAAVGEITRSVESSLPSSPCGVFAHPATSGYKSNLGGKV